MLGPFGFGAFICYAFEVELGTRRITNTFIPLTGIVHFFTHVSESSHVTDHNETHDIQQYSNVESRSEPVVAIIVAQIVKICLKTMVQFSFV